MGGGGGEWKKDKSIFSSPKPVQTGAEAHPAYFSEYRGSSRGKRLRWGVDTLT